MDVSDPDDNSDDVPGVWPFGRKLPDLLHQVKQFMDNLHPLRSEQRDMVLVSSVLERRLLYHVSVYGVPQLRYS